MKKFSALAANSATLILILALRPPEAQAQNTVPMGGPEPAAPTALPQATPSGTVQPRMSQGSVKAPKADSNVLLTAGQCRGIGGVVAVKFPGNIPTKNNKNCYGLCRTVDSEGVIREACITKSFE